ncbi:MAG: PIG-L deacetylase family protein [bacterium]
MPRLVALIPHPDDESYSFGGTIALAAKAGWECFIYCASSGEKGKRHDGGPTTHPAVAAQREAELEESCAVLGCNPPTFLRRPDGQLRTTSYGGNLLVGIFSEMTPDLVLSIGADGAYGHPDHVAVYKWVVRAWEKSGRAFPLLFPVFPKGLFLPQYEKCIGMMGDPPEPPREAIGSDTWHYEIPIESVRDTKLASIAAHRSQLPGGDPRAIFPPGIVDALLDTECFSDASGRYSETIAGMLTELA